MLEGSGCEQTDGREMMMRKRRRGSYRIDVIILATDLDGTKAHDHRFGRMDVWMGEIDVERVGRAVAFVLHGGSSGRTIAPHYCRRTMNHDAAFCWRYLFNYCDNMLNCSIELKN